MNRKSPPEAPANDSSPSQLGALVWGFLKWSVGLSVAGVLSVSLLVALALAMAYPQLPWDLSQVSWDYAWHDAPNTHAASYTVCAVPLSDLQPMLDWVRAANLMPWVVDVQAQALQRWSEHVQRLVPASANAQSSPLAMGLALRRFVA